MAGEPIVNILYLTTAPAPAVPGTDALFQELDALRMAFGGELAYLYPLRRPTVLMPPALLGLQHVFHAPSWNARFDLFHVYGSVLKDMPFLRLLRKPIVFTAAAGLGSGGLQASALRRLAGLVVSSEAEWDRVPVAMRSRVHLIRPGIDRARFTSVPPAPAAPPFTVLVGSAPWTPAQFASKGVVALLDALKRMDDLRLVFLWRGWHREMLDRLMAERGVADRCEVRDGWVDVPQVIARCHAAVVLAAQPKLVKAYPHSLLEALAAGRPVLASDTLGMARHLQETGCGVVVRGVEADAVVAALAELRAGYADYARKAEGSRASAFGLDVFVEAHRQVYREACS